MDGRVEGSRGGKEIFTDSLRYKQAESKSGDRETKNQIQEFKKTGVLYITAFFPALEDAASGQRCWC